MYLYIQTDKVGMKTIYTQKIPYTVGRIPRIFMYLHKLAFQLKMQLKILELLQWLRFVHVTRFLNAVRKSLSKEEPLPDQSTELTTNLALLRIERHFSDSAQ